MRRKIRRTKTRLLTRACKWWLPYIRLLMEAQAMGYVLKHHTFRRRTRYWIEHTENLDVFLFQDGTVVCKEIGKRVFTSGSLHSCITALKLMTDWREYE